ncbi:hypothetical protein [Flavobacterium sp. CF136]|uniref:hypothetical protein n=1 Tax=Flavobacterium sp. (strain CF136) TaxID=1144313 RepID=UPI000271A76D|nr:hypothetical protein [Flavobacterium sp. CF136]EJL66324.1 hypothetical protein PMI10_00672 [Flavobacterium sp. CF136]
MITLSLIWKNIKYIAVIALVIAVVWFYKDYQFQKLENSRQTENASQLRKSDSLRFTTQILTANEIKDYLQYQNSDLKKKLDNAGIKVSRIESIVSNSYKYRDTSKRETDVSGLVAAIKNSIPKEQTWSDTTKCLTVDGIVSFDGQKLKVVVNDREFKNKSDAVAYWERRQWKFLGIKTRLFGKKEFTSINFDECGESRVMKIEKKK